MDGLKYYIYLDKDGIDSLLAQITSEFIEEKRIQSKSEKKSSINGKIGLSDLLKKLLKSEVSGEISWDGVTTIDKKIVKPYETKLEEILKYVNDNEVLIKNSNIDGSYVESKSNFIYTNLDFNINIDYNNWTTAIAEVLQFGYMSFYCGKNLKNNITEYDYSDNYYKRLRYGNTSIVMNMSVNKMNNFSATTSHLATIIRGTKGKNIKFGVFGYIFKLTKDLYQIKPYAVWI